MRRRSIHAIAVFALAATALTGCSAEDVSPESIADAAKATTSTRGARVAVDGTITGPSGEVTMTGAGVMDPRRQLGLVRYEVAGPNGETRLEQVVDRYVIYMSSPEIEDELPGEKSWIRIDLRKATKALGADVGQFGQTGGADATRLLDYLRATGDAKNEGEEEIRGVDTTHYEAVVDLRKYPRLVPESERAQARRGIESVIDLTGESKVPTDVWIDEHKLIRRVEQEVEMHLPGAPPITMDIGYELYDFGKRVTVKTPPADDVEDVTELATQQAAKLRGKD